MACPLCGSQALKIIYLGLPMKLCEEPECSCIWGFWAWVPVKVQVNDGGWSFYAYTGSYISGLWRWLTRFPKEDET